MIGGLDEYDGVCSYLCAGSNARVVSVDYRLAPGASVSVALEDCIDAVDWVAAQGAALGDTRGKLVIAGDSAGANLAAAVCQGARRQPSPAIARQVLLYPCLLPRDRADFPSRHAYGGDTHFLNETGFEYFLGLYRRTAADETNPSFWPGLSADLAGLPEAYIATAEFDMLRDEARVYGDALRAAGTAGHVSGIRRHNAWVHRLCRHRQTRPRGPRRPLPLPGALVTSRAEAFPDYLSRDALSVTLTSFLSYALMSAILSPLGVVSVALAEHYAIGVSAATATFSY